MPEGHQAKGAAGALQVLDTQGGARQTAQTCQDSRQQ